MIRKSTRRIEISLRYNKIIEKINKTAARGKELGY